MGLCFCKGLKSLEPFVQLHAHLAERFWEKGFKRGDYGNFKNYVKANYAETKEKHWYSEEKKNFDQAWLKNIFLDKDGHEFEDSFFHSRVKFDDKNEFDKVKKILKWFS